MNLSAEDRQEIRNIAREEVNVALARISNDLHQAYVGGRFGDGTDADQVIDYLSERILSATRWNS